MVTCVNDVIIAAKSRIKIENLLKLLKNSTNIDIG